MKNVLLGTFMFGVVALSGCASLSMPSAEHFARMPVVRFGNPVPADTDYILHFPAGEPVPFRVLAQGNLFKQEETANMAVVLTRNIYTHRNWVSYDQNNWVDHRQLMNLVVEIKVPGYDYPKPGLIRIQMDAK